MATQTEPESFCTGFERMLPLPPGDEPRDQST